MALRSEEVKERHLLRPRTGSIDSSTSIFSFSSTSSTLYPHLQEDEDEKRSLFEDPISPIHEYGQDQHIFSTTQQPLKPPSWRQTPLTFAGLTCLALRHLHSLAHLLLPSFLFVRSTPRHLHATSHLDGLRGIAALIVLLDHFVLNWHYPLRNGYLSSPTDSFIFQVPIIRLLFAGRASVAVFFAISGFVLAYKPLKLIRSHNKESALTTLSSSVFRRAIRLYVPIIFGTAISAYLSYRGLYTPVPSRSETLPPQMATLNHQYQHWFYATIALLLAGVSADPNKPFTPAYNGHLWTIPVEFFGSMVVFLAVLGFARTGCKVRMCGLSTLAMVGLWCGRWDLTLFIGGAVVAEGSLVSADSDAEGEGEEELPTHYRYEIVGFTSPEPTQLTLSDTTTALAETLAVFKPFFALIILTLSLYLLSYAGESPSPGIYHSSLLDLPSPFLPRIYHTLHLGPEHYFLALGAILLLCVLSLPSLTPHYLLRMLRRPLVSPFAQYLGDVSYSLYIVHGMVLFTLGTRLMERWTGMVGESRWVDDGFGGLVEAVVRVQADGGGGGYGGDGAWGEAFWLVGAANAMVVFWVSDFFWRLIDGRVVGWGRRVESWVVGRK